MRLKNFGLIFVVAATVLLGAANSFAAPGDAATAPSGLVTSVPGTTEKVVTVAEGGAQEGEKAVDPVHSQLDLGTMLVTIAIFICLFVVLRATAWKPILAGLKSREDAIRESIEGAKKARADTDRITQELQAKIATVQRQALAELTQVKADAVKLGESVRAQAEAEAAALKERTLREIEAAKQQALNEINTRVVTLGTMIAGKILQRNVNADDQQRLVDESLGELAKKN
jgi:F-type H+-transporting ATPase subunit b